MTQKQKLEMNSIKQQYEKNGLALKSIISFAEIQMLTDNDLVCGPHLVKQQLGPTTKLQCHIHLFLLKLQLQTELVESDTD